MIVVLCRINGVKIMARVTIENCLKKVNGHFDLVLLAGERAKQISFGKRTELVKKGVKTHVTSLREIEEGYISVETLRSNLYNRITNYSEVEESTQMNEADNMLEELHSSDFIMGELEEVVDNANFFADDIFSDTVEEQEEENIFDFETVEKVLDEEEKK